MDNQENSQPKNKLANMFADTDLNEMMELDFVLPFGDDQQEQQMAESNPSIMHRHQNVSEPSRSENIAHQEDGPNPNEQDTLTFSSPQPIEQSISAPNIQEEEKMFMPHLGTVSNQKSNSAPPKNSLFSLMQKSHIAEEVEMINDDDVFFYFVDDPFQTQNQAQTEIMQAQMPQNSQSIERSSLEEQHPVNQSDKKMSLVKSGSIKSEPSQIEQIKKQLSHELDQQKIKKKSPSQVEDSMNNSQDVSKLLVPQSSIVKAHSYNSNQDDNSVHQSKPNITSVKDQDVRSKMYSEESKHHDKRESFSNPQPKLKNKPLNVALQGSIESDIQIASITNSSGLPSYIGRGRPNHPGPQRNDQEAPVIEITDYKQLFELMMNNAQQPNGSQMINMSMIVGGQKLDVCLNPQQLMDSLPQKSDSLSRKSLDKSSNKLSEQSKPEVIQPRTKHSPLPKEESKNDQKQAALPALKNKFDFSQFLSKNQSKKEDDTPNVIIPPEFHSTPPQTSHIVSTTNFQANPELISNFFAQYSQTHNLRDQKTPIADQKDPNEEEKQTALSSSQKKQNTLKNIKLDDDSNILMNYNSIQNSRLADIKEESKTHTASGTDNNSGSVHEQIPQTHTLKESRLNQIHTHQIMNSINQPTGLSKAFSVLQPALFSAPRVSDPPPQQIQGSNTLRFDFVRTDTILTQDASQIDSTLATQNSGSDALLIRSATIGASEFQGNQSSYDYNLMRNKPIDRLTGHQKNELILLITQQRQEIEDKENKINRLLLFLKQKYSIEQDSDLYELIQKYDEAMNSKLHLAFLFSSPLVGPYSLDNSSEDVFDMTKIEYQRELQTVVQSLKNTKSLIKYRKSCATKNNFVKILTEGTFALHFAGHGAKNNQETFPKDYHMLKGQGDLLVFEDEDGKAQYVTEMELRNYLKASDASLQFVFVASCHSYNTGKTFLNAGAKHVISTNDRILNETSIQFSQKFYSILFSQSKTVCQAFEMAKQSIRDHENEQIRKEFSKFVIFRDTDDSNFSDTHRHRMSNVKKHCCQPLGPFNQGQLEDCGLQEKPSFKLDMSKLNEIPLGRQKDMYKIIHLINQNRLVTVIGLPGIGKTTTTKSVGMFLEEREKFSDGIIYISMSRRYNGNMLISSLYHFIKKSLTVDQLENLQKITKAIQHHEEIGQRIMPENIEDVEEVFKVELAINQSDLDKIIYCLQEKYVLLILDNLEDPLNADGKNFIFIIQQLLNKCQNIKILSTSRINIGQVGETEEAVHVLQELNHFFSVKLFFQKAKIDIDKDQIIELLRHDNIEVNEEICNDVERSQKYLLQLLQNHSLFKRLSGHPHAITLVAQLARDSSLVEVNQTLNSKTFQESYTNDSHPLNALRLSMETAVGQMLYKKPKAIELFCLIGLMPAGITEEALSVIWGDDWYGYINDLLKAQLVQKKQAYKNEELEMCKYVLLPFMNYYAITLNEHLEEDKQTILKYYVKLMQEFFEKLDNDKFIAQQHMIRLKLVQQETNIWEALNRITDDNKKQGNSERVDKKYTESISLEKKQAKQKQAKEEEEKLQEEVMQDLTNEMSNSRIDVFDYALTVHSNQPADAQTVKRLSILKKQPTKEHLPVPVPVPVLQKKRSNSVTEVVSGVNGPTGETKDKKSRSGSQTNKHTVSNNSLATNQNASSLDKGMTISSEEDFQQIGKRQPKIPKKTGLLVDKDISELFQLYDSDSQMMDNNQLQSVKKLKLNSRKSKKHDQQPSILPSQSLAQYMSESEDTSFLFNQDNSHGLLFGKAKAMKQQDSTPVRCETAGDKQYDTFLQDMMNFYDKPESTNDPFRRGSVQVSQDYLRKSTQVLALNKTRSNSESNQAEIKPPTPKNMEPQDSLTSNPEEKKEDEFINKKSNPTSEATGSQRATEEQKSSQVQAASRLKQPTKLDISTTINSQATPTKNFLQVPQENDANSRKLTLKERKEATFKNIQQKKQQAEDETELKKEKKPRPGQIRNNFQRYKTMKKIEFPIEGTLIIYFASNLILNMNYDTAIRVLSNCGLFYYFEGERGICCKANVQKLLAVAYYMQNQDFGKIESLLTHAKNKFQLLQIYHGLAVVSFARAHFFYTKSTEFVFSDRNEDSVLKEALDEVQTALKYYERIRHRNGHAQCLTLETQIESKLQIKKTKAEQSTKNDKIKELRLQEKGLQQENKSSYIHRQQGFVMSLLIEPSTSQFLEITKNNNKRDFKGKDKIKERNSHQKESFDAIKKKEETQPKEVKPEYKPNKQKAPGSPRLNQIKEKPVDLLNLSLKSQRAKKSETEKTTAQNSDPSTSTRKQSGDSNEFNSLKALAKEKEKIKAPKITKRYAASIDSRNPDLDAPAENSDNSYKSDESDNQDNDQQNVLSASDAEQLSVSSYLNIKTKPIIQNTLQIKAQQIQQLQVQNQIEKLISNESEFDNQSMISNWPGHFSNIKIKREDTSHIQLVDQLNMNDRMQAELDNTEILSNSGESQIPNILNTSLDTSLILPLAPFQAQQFIPAPPQFQFQNLAPLDEYTFKEQLELCPRGRASSYAANPQINIEDTEERKSDGLSSMFDSQLNLQNDTSDFRLDEDEEYLKQQDIQIVNQFIKHELNEKEKKAKKSNIFGEFEKLTNSTQIDKIRRKSQFVTQPSQQILSSIKQVFTNASAPGSKSQSVTTIQPQEQITQSLTSQTSQGSSIISGSKVALTQPVMQRTQQNEKVIEESIEFDKSLLTPDQQGVIQSLYDMYNSETIEAEKHYLKMQIHTYLKENNILYKKFDPAQSSSSSDKPTDIPNTEQYFKVQKGVSQQVMKKQLNQSQRMNVAKAKTLGKNMKRDVQSFYQLSKQTIIDEVEEEQNLSDSSEGPVIARNTPQYQTQVAKQNLKAMEDYQEHEDALNKKSKKTSPIGPYKQLSIDSVKDKNIRKVQKKNQKRQSFVKKDIETSLPSQEEAKTETSKKTFQTNIMSKIGSFITGKSASTSNKEPLLSKEEEKQTEKKPTAYQGSIQPKRLTKQQSPNEKK